MRRHVEQLAAKQYWAALPCTPEFVVMFLPTEAFLYAAEDQDPSLWEFASRNNVLLATPTNLLTLLRTVALIWSQEEIAKNTQQVMEHGRELHKRLTTIGRPLRDAGKTHQRRRRVLRQDNRLLQPQRAAQRPQDGRTRRPRRHARGTEAHRTHHPAGCRDHHTRPRRRPPDVSQLLRTETGTYIGSSLARPNRAAATVRLPLFPARARPQPLCRVSRVRAIG
ncbi:DNA recombination protein RmuC [Nocardia sp. KC 131]|uniref:DNA recombination protein RmuC n=1 Tax=Nocardia arseniciresistens TaxID=3392119 RepID=UPI00398F512B